MNKNRKKFEEPSALGQIVDLPIEDFKEAVEEQGMNVGTSNNLILCLESTYNELNRRKESLLFIVFQKKSKKEDTTKEVSAIQGVYAELVKIEEKVTFLKNRVSKLLEDANQ